MSCKLVFNVNVTQATRTNTVFTPTQPIADRDIIRIFLTMGDEPGPVSTPSPPAGFSEIMSSAVNTALGGTGNGEMQVWVWEKRASGESGAYTVTHASSFSAGYMEVIRGAVEYGSAEDFAATENVQDNNSTYTALGGTTTKYGSFITFYSGTWNSIAGTIPAGSDPEWTERFDTTGAYAMNGLKRAPAAIPDVSVSGNAQGATGGSISILASVLAAPEKVRSGGKVPLASFLEDDGRFNELDVRNWWREALAA